ncbi:MAG TPA: hypothetical protein EYP46_01285 [Hadesarchaea archaeon]|nr:hypothetical protein [Hadesarchaea archaeon]
MWGPSFSWGRGRGWGRGWFGPWPGRGPFSYLPPWQRPGWWFGRGACWWLFGPWAWSMFGYPWSGYPGTYGFAPYPDATAPLPRYVSYPYPGY